MIEPLFSTAWEREDYERQKRGEPPLGPLRTGASQTWECKARPWEKRDPPQECDWPWCGCDPKADKVLEAIQENDCVILARSALEEVFNLAQSHAMQMPERNPQRRMAIAAAFRECRKAVEPVENEEVPPTHIKEVRTD